MSDPFAAPLRTPPLFPGVPSPYSTGTDASRPLQADLAPVPRRPSSDAARGGVAGANVGVCGGRAFISGMAGLGFFHTQAKGACRSESGTAGDAVGATGHLHSHRAHLRG